MDDMLIDIQKQFETLATKSAPEQRTNTIPREYVVPNNEIKIDGQGILQRMLESYQQTKRPPL